MMADFYQAFGEDADMDKQIPQEILEELNKELPANLMYVQNEDGKCSVIPRPDRLDKPISMTTKFDVDPDRDAYLISRLKEVPKEKWAEYFYRTQKTISVKNVKIGDDQKLIPLEQTVGNPLTDESNEMKDCKMFPEKFADSVPLLFESKEGDKVTISFQQQAYDSLTEVKYCNVDFPALKIELYVYSPLVEECKEESKTSKSNPMIAAYSVTPTKAATVSEAVEALHIFAGLFAGTTRVDGQIMISKAAQDKFEPQKVKDALDFWNKALKLEKKIGVQFVPNADFSMEDVRFFAELDSCLNERKPIVWRHPFESFHVNEFKTVDKNANANKIIGAEGAFFRFTEGPIKAALLGTEFEIFSSTEMKDFVITNIQWDDETEKSGEIYITDAPGKTWTLKRLYMTRGDAEKLKEKRDTSHENVSDII